MQQLVDRHLARLLAEAKVRVGVRVRIHTRGQPRADLFDVRADVRDALLQSIIGRFSTYVAWTYRGLHDTVRKTDVEPSAVSSDRAPVKLVAHILRRRTRLKPT